jgi:hypothetical protein
MGIPIKAEELAISVMVECFEEYYKYCTDKNHKTKTLYREDAFFDTVTFFANKLKSRFPGFNPLHFYEACKVQWSPDIDELSDHAAKVLRKKEPAKRDIRLLARMVIQFLDKGDKESKVAKRPMRIRRIKNDKPSSAEIPEIEIQTEKPSGSMKYQLGIQEPWKFRLITGKKTVPMANSTREMFSSEPRTGERSEKHFTGKRDYKYYRIVRVDHGNRVAYCDLVKGKDQTKNPGKGGSTTSASAPSQYRWYFMEILENGSPGRHSPLVAYQSLFDSDIVAKPMVGEYSKSQMFRIARISNGIVWVVHTISFHASQKSQRNPEHNSSAKKMRHEPQPASEMEPWPAIDPPSP